MSILENSLDTSMFTTKKHQGKQKELEKEGVLALWSQPNFTTIHIRPVEKKRNQLANRMNFKLDPHCFSTT